VTHVQRPQRSKHLLQRVAQSKESSNKVSVGEDFFLSFVTVFFKGFMWVLAETCKNITKKPQESFL
jgi:hypothetical protein